VTNTGRDLGALGGPLAGAAAAGSPATSVLPGPALTADGKSDATDVARHRGVFLAGGPLHTASFGIFHRLPVAGSAPHRPPAGTPHHRRPGRRPLATEPAEPHQARGVADPAGRTSGLVVTGAAGVLPGRSGRAGRESP